MKEKSYPVTNRSRVRRLPKRGSYDKEVVHDILDRGIVCHVGMVTPDGPLVIPMGYARREDEVLVHGSAKSRLLVEASKGAPLCVAVTLVDGLVLARSTFHHSINYRSVVLYGRGEAVTEPEAKARALDEIVEHLVPGRNRDARPPSEAELAATLVVRIPIEEASAKIRKGPPVDDEEDLSLDIWAGVVPFVREAGEPIRDEHTRQEIDVPDYVRSYPGGRT